MFPKNFRLPAREIKPILDTGRRIGGKWISLSASNKKNQNYPKAAIVIPARLDKRAAARNRMKRRLVEIVRAELGQILTEKKMVIICKQKFDNVGFQELRKEVIGLMKRGRILKQQ